MEDLKLYGNMREAQDRVLGLVREWHAKRAAGQHVEGAVFAALLDREIPAMIEAEKAVDAECRLLSGSALQTPVSRNAAMLEVVQERVGRLVDLLDRAAESMKRGCTLEQALAKAMRRE